ncbi:glycosyltransferase [Williamsia sp. DF01-3]|uniref:glycosyltransferase n=1 Tax=Williamsia sp. DF01-3 TaxID=2934157 RepID=UPI001FF6EFD5|nr:glycosyltransferase [Williamsia sp. DF01-3]MCK0519114.1 glycosyltransferase [Williamsia sp. DF01-3]
MSAIPLDDGRMILPGNRWDLVENSPDRPLVSVVIPYYNQQRQLNLVLKALTAQTYPANRMEVVVADDGSAQTPDVGEWTSKLSVTVVSQEDKGFRAAAARNLGASSSTGSILCFLDADTVPTPDYIRQAVRLPAVAPDTIVVGRRKHADLAQVTADSVVSWLSDNAHTEQTHQHEPHWLVDGYDRTLNLLTPGWDGYKYMLSAVMTCSRTLFEDIGGFDESFVQYGGEDWELANRAFMMGAVFAHEPAAVAWHDGPDWAERSVSDRAAEKNAEALALVPLLTDPAARASGLRYLIPDVAVLVSTDGHTAPSLLLTVSSVLRGVDAAVWLTGLDADNLLRELGIHDSRVRLGEPDAAVLSRCRFVVEVTGRVVFSADSIARLTAEVAPGAAGQVNVEFGSGSTALVTMWSSRALHRSRRWSEEVGLTTRELIEMLFGVRHVESDDVGIVVAEDDPSLSW